MKNKKFLLIILLCLTSLLTCVTNPLTKQKTMALVGNSELFSASFQQYNQFLSENKVVNGTSDAKMVERIGANIRRAAEKWLASEGNSSYLKDYKWEYHLVDSKQINAWCMPGGKIVVYTGILPLTQTEDGLATVMGHEVAHALLNHGQQRVSASVLQQIGAVGVAIAASGLSKESQALIMAAYGVGTTLGGTLPFSRKHESEADHYGLLLMAIAGYNPEASVPFWQRMSALGGGTPEFLSTHPSDKTRIKQLRALIPEAKKKARQIK
ncbi:M48 family metallopeptidase [Treponema sp. R80B11-R83G3]